MAYRQVGCSFDKLAYMKNCVFTSIAKSKKISAEYTIEICASYPDRCIPFEKKEFFSRLCETGCINYNKKWSCPPFAPAFSVISSHWSKLYVLYMRMPMYAYIGNWVSGRKHGVAEFRQSYGMGIVRHQELHAVNCHLRSSANI